MNDFTVSRYLELLLSLKRRGREFQPLNEYIQSANHSFSHSLLILRHDVDLLPHNALAMAQLEHDLGIRGTYYFRIVPASFNPQIIEQIAELGHEIGYHYEDVDLVVKRQKANGKRQTAEFGGRMSISGIEPLTNNNEPLTDLIDRAMESFVKNLEKMRKIVDIKTICMHGSPMSKYDNRLLWTKYDYHEYGIIGEPYFDVDFSRVAYYTDTGRRWDGEAVSVRDKVYNGEYRSNGVSEERRTDNRQPITGNIFPKYRTTREMIKAIEEDSFPQKAMLTIHPQRWHDRAMPWVKELVWQRCKNVVKRVVVGLGTE